MATAWTRSLPSWVSCIVCSDWLWTRTTSPLSLRSSGILATSMSWTSDTTSSGWVGQGGRRSGRGKVVAECGQVVLCGQGQAVADCGWAGQSWGWVWCGGVVLGLAGARAFVEDEQRRVPCFLYFLMWVIHSERQTQMTDSVFLAFRMLPTLYRAGKCCMYNTRGTFCTYERLY